MSSFIWLLLSACFFAASSYKRTWTRKLYQEKNNVSLNATLEGTLLSDPVEKGFCDDVLQLSGYYSINATDKSIRFSKHYFYWFFESRNDPAKDPVIIWLTGGPGCSSMLALLGENGPCYINNKDKLTLKKNPYSWNSNANIMWIDQPAGVGFSYSENPHGYDTNEEQVGDDMYHFLQSFFHANSKYKDLPFYVFGESYGGHYVPAIAYRIYHGNQHSESSDDLHIPLAGIGIGNGLTSPEIQYQYYPQMAYNNSYGIKAVTEDVYQSMLGSIPYCTKMIQYCQSVKVACIAAEMYCNAKLIGPFQLSGLNVYDIREKCEHFPMCYDFSDITKFFRLPSTLEKLHVNTHESAKWKECNMMVHTAFTFDWMRNFDNLVVPLLHEEKNPIKVLVYAGDADYIVNWLGCKAWTLALKWNDNGKFKNAQDKDWIFSETKEKIGEIRSYKGLSFVRVYAAGHMVPMNQPRNALYLVNQFIHGTKEDEAKSNISENTNMLSEEGPIKDDTKVSNSFGVLNEVSELTAVA